MIFLAYNMTRKRHQLQNIEVNIEYHGQEQSQIIGTWPKPLDVANKYLPNDNEIKVMTNQFENSEPISWKKKILVQKDLKILQV